MYHVTTLHAAHATVLYTPHTAHTYTSGVRLSDFRARVRCVKNKSYKNLTKDTRYFIEREDFQDTLVDTPHPYRSR